MFAVSLSQHARQSLHSLPWAGAAQVLSSGFVDTVDVHGQCFTGPWFIICELILIIKFDGITAGSISVKNLTSRVGSQGWVPGVLLQTSNMFFRCCTLWRSPESCHLKNGSLSISTTIASIQRGSIMEASRLDSASLTFLNRYRPFSA